MNRLTVKKFVKKGIKQLKRLMRRFGFEVEVNRIKKLPSTDQINLNIGAGDYEILGFASLDIYTPHYYASKEAFLKERVEYDIRKDELPYTDESVHNIYINHVIEHIETEHIQRFFQEAYRVLKPDGVLRIGCPDAEFLFEVSSFQNHYWDWRKPWFKGYMKDAPEQCSQMDALVGMLSTQKLDGYLHGVEELTLKGENIGALDYAELMERLREDVTFRIAHPGDHINVWDFQRLKALGAETGFRHIIRSKPHGSVSAEMQGKAFDRNHQHMSLYVDLVK